MGEGYTLMILRDDGSPPRSVQVNARSVLGMLGVGAVIAVVCLVVGWQLGVLTAGL